MDYIVRKKIKELKGTDISKYKYAHEKKDGHYIEIYKHTDRRVEIFRKKRVENIWPKLRRIKHIRMAVNNMPPHTVLQCELYLPDGPASSVITAINSSSQELRVCPFAVPMYQGVCPFGMTLMRFNEVVEDWGFDTALVIPLLKTKSMISVEGLLKLARVSHSEGWVLKESHLSGWVKLKPTKTVDGLVRTYTISDSDSHNGGLKAIQISLDKDGKWVEVASVGSGFEAEYRKSVNLPSLIGRIAEVEYDCVCSNGRLRFPRFKRWRDSEKSSDECLYSQIGE